MPAKPEGSSPLTPTLNLGVPEREESRVVVKYKRGLYLSVRAQKCSKYKCFLLLMERIVWAFLGPANVNFKKKSEIEKTKLFSCEKLTV